MLSVLALWLALIGVAPAPAAAPTSSPTNICPGPPASVSLLNPPELYSSNGVLNVTLTQEETARGGATVMCWVYQTTQNGKRVNLATPPTLNVRQGERLSITLVNALGPFNPNSATPPPIIIDQNTVVTKAVMPMPMASGAPKNPYALMCGQPQLIPTPTPDPVTGRIYGYHRSPWNEASLHFHGLNTSPKQPSDDVVDVLLCPTAKTALPNSYHYIVDIPKNEPPGTYWYHPHPHGEALYQMFLGMTGAIVVHSAVPSIPDQLPNHIVLVRDLPFLSGISKWPLKDMIRSHQPNLMQIRSELAQGTPNYYRRPGGDPFQPPETCPPPPGGVQFQTDALTINGLPLPQNAYSLLGLPTSSLGVGETQYWRVANTAANTTLDIELHVNGKQMPLMVTARDGVALVTKNGQPTWQPVALNHVILMPASRVDFYMTGAKAGDKMVVRTRTVDTGCIGDTDLARNLFNVVVSAKKVVQHVSIPATYNALPQRFSDLAAQRINKARTFVLTEYARTDEPEPDFYITETSNPKAYEHPYDMEGPPSVVVKEGTIEEWTILNYTNEIHAFHIHQIHFLPIAGINMEQGLNQLLDTVEVPYGTFDAKGHMVPGGVKVIMDFRGKDIIGTFVYHCHIMEHEDNGMMAKIQVIP